MTKITRKWIEQASDDELVRDLYMEILTSLDPQLDEKTQLQKFPPGLRMIRVAMCLDDQVCNGGFHQYFWNTEGKDIDLIEKAFAHFGAKKHATLASAAVKIFRKDDRIRKSYEVERTLESFGESAREDNYDDLDTQYFEIKENIESVICRYVRKHPDEFVTS